MAEVQLCCVYVSSYCCVVSDERST